METHPKFQSPRHGMVTPNQNPSKTRVHNSSTTEDKRDRCVCLMTPHVHVGSTLTPDSWDPQMEVRGSNQCG
jgi:hypothetical protein